MKKLIVKVCGLTQDENIKAIDSLDVDFLGFIFYKPSPRYFDAQKVPETNKNKVAVFVNASINEILQITKENNFKFIQLHGEETPEFVQQLKMLGFNMIKTYSIDTLIDNNYLADYQSFIDYFLFDTKGPLKGGNSFKFNWNIIEGYSLNKPFLLSGGIDIDDVAEIKKINHPQLAGVDINSRFEIAPGLKNTEKIKKFLKLLNN